MLIALAGVVAQAQTPGAAQSPPAASDPAMLALIATATFPLPQSLSVVLVPPPSPYAPVAAANFPAPQPLSVVLVPPASPYAAIAAANLPTPQSLSLVLVPRAAPQVATLGQLLRALQPPLRNLTLTLQPPLTPPLGQSLGALRPPLRNLTLTLMPPLTPPLGQLLGTLQPPLRNLTLTLRPPLTPPLGQLLGALQPPLRSLTLTLQPPLPEQMPDPAPGATASGQSQSAADNPGLLSLIATASFPVSQAPSVVLVPPPSLYAPIASANLPLPQSLSVVLVPPRSPYAVIAAANFPAPQPLSVVLVPGAVPAATTVADPLATAQAPQILGPADFSVQIVQVIPRRGANFFDRNDPTGLASVVVPVAVGGGGGGGSGGGTCAPGAIIGPAVYVEAFGGGQLIQDANTALILSPVGAGQVRLTVTVFASDRVISPGDSGLGSVSPATFSPTPVGDRIVFRVGGGLETLDAVIGRSGANVCFKQIAFPCNWC